MKELEMNPYVVQIDKFVTSLEKLSHAFLHLEKEKNELTDEQYRNMNEDVKERLCKQCEKKTECKGYELLREVLETAEDYGAELNVEVKRNIQKKCVQAPLFVRTVLDVYKHEKQNMMWQQKMAQSREGCVIQLDAFAQMIQHSTRELDASIFADDYLEKKIKIQFQRAGLKILSTVFFVSPNGKYEIHVTLKAKKGECVTTKEVAKMLSEKLKPKF